MKESKSETAGPVVWTCVVEYFQYGCEVQIVGVWPIKICHLLNALAGLAWILTLAACFFFVKYAGIEIFFVSLPGWFVAATLYICISMVYQKKIRPAGQEVQLLHLSLS